jgi:hypothetical protein
MRPAAGASIDREHVLGCFFREHGLWWQRRLGLTNRRPGIAGWLRVKERQILDG